MIEVNAPAAQQWMKSPIAKAAGQVLVVASRETGLSIGEWLRQVERSIDPSSVGSGKAIERKGKEDGPLYGEVIVFMGALTIARSEAADMAARIGCNVAQGVTKQTTLLFAPRNAANAIDFGPIFVAGFWGAPESV